MLKLLVGMPTYSGINPKVVLNLIDFDINSQKDGLDLHFSFPQGSIISALRNQIMRNAMKAKVDWVLMWDSDIQINDKEFFIKMVEEAAKREAPVIGLPCCLKSKVRKLNYQRIKSKPDEPERWVIGTGVMLINMAWIREHWSKAPWFHVIDTEEGFWPEDFNFCEQVWDKGGKVEILGGIKTVHWGAYGFKSNR